MPAAADIQDLLVPVFRSGKCVYTRPELNAIRDRVQNQLGMFHGGIKRFVNPHQYPVGLEQTLHKRRTELVLQARGYKE
jgi:nicotinate phosphoribosyltransferase